MRRQFYGERIDGIADHAAQKDLLDVAHAASAEIAICHDCGILVRCEREMPNFETDHYEPFAMERMLHAHIAVYRNKAKLYRRLLHPGANVLEVGSYVGGFLHVAAEWGWNAAGVDVGRDTSRFVRAHGYRTFNVPLEDCRFDGQAFDGVFIWNCFEQIEDPQRLLAEVKRVLRPGGVLIVRTPNASLYIDMQGNSTILGHSNLLGFPHLYGYTEVSLQRLISAHGFTLIRMGTDRHIHPGIRPLTFTAKREASSLRSVLRKAWIEATFLHTSEAEVHMAEKETIQRARRDRAQGKAPSTQAGEFVREEMEHIRQGKHGARSTKQAIAIGLSKARRSGVRLAPPKGGSVRTRESARSAIRNRGRKPSATRSRAVRSALKREGHSAASRSSLSRQARTTARRRGAASRHRAAVKAARTRARSH
ncbi:MAG TPA: methyltransferase domain-containing protein [Thermoanaerobaculia bacterium]|nr:methyltransferase domain-containing protein [Thermoanaerobaculia bacterium]